MSNKRLTYSKAGVSIERGDQFVSAISKMVKATKRSEIESSVGGFAALSKMPRAYKDPRLVVSTDGVGTKVLLAKQLKIFNSVGIDLVAMSVNDILTLGGEPLLFLDYLATSKINLKIAKSLIEGIAKGCKQAGCALVGGETAEMPQVYRNGDFDLAGFCVGVVEKQRIIDGRQVKPGDTIFGIPSTGVHSNGFSLVRAILKKKRIKLHSTPKGFKSQIGKLLLAPTKIYVKDVQAILKRIQPKAMAHITGGGIEGNLVRVLPKGMQAEIHLKSWTVPLLFRWLQSQGDVSSKDMFRTFNMGIGYILVVSKKDEKFVQQSIRGVKKIGTITSHSSKKSNAKVIFKS
ncbi:MAG: phosphoribosylformylglycinamidine cyclo-ligase [Bdellovibrionales bacterium]|nr:phosphoribosylformylglycinamidine cyclo-ligase [Bdellovibrionales bacterium]